jgi:hypothetical protein
MVYDTADRLIFTQDGNQRAKTTKEWTFTIPDALGRTVITGTCINALTYTADPLKNIVVNASYVGGTSGHKGYTTSGVSLSTPTVLTVNYYDDYSFLGSTIMGLNTKSTTNKM